MASKNYVIINGRAYNTITGMVMDNIKIEKSEIEKEQSVGAARPYQIFTPHMFRNPAH